MSITEPATLLTDYLLAAVGVALAVRLWRGRDGQKSRTCWALALLATALAAVVGGTWHGFKLHLPRPLQDGFWSTTYLAIGLANLLLVLAAAEAALARRWRGPVLAAALARFLAYAVLLLSRGDFKYVIYDFALTLLCLALLAADLQRRARPAASWIAWGVFTSLLGAVVQVAKLAPHPHFNHNDLFHVIQAVGLWLFFRGAVLLQDR